MFKQKDITDFVLNDIESNQTLKNLMKKYNAFIAGGAALSLLRNMSINEYMKRNNLADIDLYFHNSLDYENAVSALKKEKPLIIEKSVTGMCHNIYFNSDMIKKIQLVGCVFGNPEKVVKTFDFKNLEVFCQNKNNNYILSSSSIARKCLDRIDVRHSRSPFLMHRICKYLKYRDYNNVTPESRLHITDWIIKASSGYYSENPDGCPNIYVDLLDNNTIKSMLDNTNIFTNENLVYMIGKVKQDVYETSEKYIDWRGYIRSDTIRLGQKDLVVKEIQRRKKHENHKKICQS